VFAVGTAAATAGITAAESAFASLATLAARLYPAEIVISTN
jgi:hypothetical protein